MPYISQINGADISASNATNATNATNAETASFLPLGTYQITASWAESASNAINARTSSTVVITNESQPFVPQVRYLTYVFNTGSNQSLQTTGSLNYNHQSNIIFATASQALTSSLLIGTGTASSISIETITNSPTITGSNYLYGTSGNNTLSIPSASTGSLQLGKNIFLATPTNGNITLYGGVSVTITSSQVSMVGGNFNLNLNAGGFTNRSQIIQTGTTSTIHISSSQILLDGTHPSGSVLFVTGSVVPTGVPANLNDGPGGNSLNRAAVQFAKSGSGDNYLLYVYIGGRWRSASLL